MLDFDNRRDIYVGSSKDEALSYAVDHWVNTAKRSIQQRGRFAVALSGGSTPKAIYERLVSIKDLDFSKVWLFWSDERNVHPDHPDSNYRMAMESFQKLPIPQYQIFRMEAETNIEAHAKDYEEKMKRCLGPHLLDLVMLGLGEDGHTASLFPETSGLLETKKLVIANHVPQLQTTRMTFSFQAINQSRHVAIYAFGSSKKEIVPKVLQAPILSKFPASAIGSAENKALWILDHLAAIDLQIP
jgi:6-phosphogluconolactonase